MQHNPAPETFIETLERIGLADLLTGFIAPERVRIWGFLEVERFAVEHGYRFEREHGNVYGRLRLVAVEPAAPAPVLPVLRVITRSAAPPDMLDLRRPPKHLGGLHFREAHMKHPSPQPLALDFPPIPTRPGVDDVEAFAPELGELGDRWVAATLAGDTDFDSELFLAGRAILAGEDEKAVLAMMTPSHPGTAEARALLLAAWRRYRLS